MKDSQIDQTAEMIIDEFPSMKIADILFLFKKAKNGEFGQIYEGLDGLKILTWFRQVWNERLDVAEFQSDNEHINTKIQFEKIIGSERTCGETTKRDVIKQVNEDWLQNQMDKNPIF